MLTKLQAIYSWSAFKHNVTDLSRVDRVVVLDAIGIRNFPITTTQMYSIENMIANTS